MNLWGKELYEHLDEVYRSCARYCVMFLSKYYAKKMWTNHERKSAQARAFRQNKEYILPTRFDKTEIPGVKETVGYLDLKGVTPKELGVMIIKKLGPREKRNYFPPNPDILFKRLRVKGARKKEEVFWKAYTFFEAFKRMTLEERQLIANIFIDGCYGELPKNTHVYLDLLKRSTGFSVHKIKRILRSLHPLGFLSCLKESDHSSDDYLGSKLMVYLEYHVWEGGYSGPSTDLAMEIIKGAIHASEEDLPDFCPSCAYKLLMDADFSQLSSATLIGRLNGEHALHGNKI